MSDMRILIALALVVSGCSKKKEEAPPPPKTTETPKPAEEKPKAPDPAPDEKPTPTEAAKPAAGDPTKEMAEKRLREMLAALEAKDYKKAMTFMASSPNIPAEKLQEGLERILEIKEISAHGIDVLMAKGQWGKLETIAPDKGPRWAQKFDKPVGECWGIVFDNAEVGFHWDGKELKFIRLDDVGKLQ